MTLDQYVSLVTRFGSRRTLEGEGGGEGACLHIISNESLRGAYAPLKYISQGPSQDIFKSKSTGTGTYLNLVRAATLVSSKVIPHFHSLELFFRPDRVCVIILIVPPCIPASESGDILGISTTAYLAGNHHSLPLIYILSSLPTASFSFSYSIYPSS